MNDQANWRPVTFTTMWPFLSDSFRLSTNVAATAKASTIRIGTIVQMISRPVWPWIGAPSDMSPGRARNVHIE